MTCSKIIVDVCFLAFKKNCIARRADYLLFIYLDAPVFKNLFIFRVGNAVWY